MGVPSLDVPHSTVYIVLAGSNQTGTNVGKFPTFFCPIGSPRFDVKTELEVIVNQSLTALGFELVELLVKGSKRRPVIDVRMDRNDGEKVSVNDCVLVSRALEDSIEPMAGRLGDYVLEVSSAGVERPLKRPHDWKRFVGRSVSVLSPALQGRHEMELLGVEGDQGAEVALLRNKQGLDIRVPLAEVKEARLVFHWKR